MPSPGAQKLASELAPLAITVKAQDGDQPAITTTLLESSDTITHLANGMDTGWTSLSPNTVTTMASALPAAFPNQGLSQPASQLMAAIGAAIDAEVTIWKDSYDPGTNLHKHTPIASVINASATSSDPIQSGASAALITRVADVFITHFNVKAG